MGKKQTKLSKRTYRAMQIRNCKAMVEAVKKKQKANTSQDPAAGIADIPTGGDSLVEIMTINHNQHVTIKNNVECESNEEVNELVFKLEETEEKVENCDDTQKSVIYESGSDVLHETQANEKIYVLKQEQIEVTIKSDDDDKKDDDESRSDTLRQTDNEELWVVRRQLCRGCHSEGTFWSLQTATEGDTYGDLLQTYFNIQLCPVSKDELALSAICAACATWLREARAFSAQARAAEERFTRFYTQNRVIALVNEVEIKKDVPKIKNEVDNIITDDIESETANSNLDNPELSTEELAPTLNKNKQSQIRRHKPASKKLPRISPSDYKRVGNLFKCTRCDELYNRSGIHEHVNNMHFHPPKYTCPHCDKTFMKLGEFRCHKDVEHSTFDGNSKQDYKFSASDYKRVGESYKCNRCEKQFKNYKYVRLHVRHTHFKIPWKKYTCPHCDKIFHDIGHYIKHKLEEHSIDERIKCDACGWLTYRKSELNKHKKGFHMLGEKKTCPDCEYFCFSEGAMKKHVVKHSTVKNYHCKYCKKSFLRKSNLNIHEKIHTGDKNKVCNVCGQAFVQRASLTYHMAKHHPEVRF